MPPTPPQNVDLRTFTYLDVLQPQTASFLATVEQGYLPIEEQAALFVEVQPGISINRVTDIATKRTDVQPGMMIVERAFGVLEMHSFDQGQVRAAGQAILDYYGKTIDDRLRPRVLSSEIIRGVDPHQSMLINRMRHGEMILKGQALYILEVHPAGYAAIACNEAEKHAPIQVLEMLSFGAFGRLWLGGGDAEITEARAAAERTLAAITGRPNEQATHL
ncbi:MAG: hypothetical protein HY719_08590 [Planctomycetes bacterium]|nr:hypothetical protein [Planctomycetota bacterium]